MGFIEKLTQDTLDGMWDYAWKYTKASNKYTFKVQKHYLSEMNFSMEDQDYLLILPNGYGLKYNSNQISDLRDAVDFSIERTVKSSIAEYMKNPNPGTGTEDNAEDSDVSVSTEDDNQEPDKN